MYCFQRNHLIFGYLSALLIGISYGVPLDEKNSPYQLDNVDDESIQMYVDIEESFGRSNKRPAEVFEDFIKKLQNSKGKNGLIPIPTSPTATPSEQPEAPSHGRKGGISDLPSSKNSPGLVDFDSDDDELPKEFVKGDAFEAGVAEEPSVKDLREKTEHTRKKSAPSTPPHPPSHVSSSPTRGAYPEHSIVQEERKTKKHYPASEDLVSERDMKALFINSGTGSSSMIPGCAIVHFHVKSRCAGNLLELTLLSRNPVQGQVRLLEGDGQVSMEGTHLTVYGVLGPLSPSGNLWKLKKRVLISDLEGECYNCDNMDVRVVLKAGDAICGMVVSCQQNFNARIVPVDVEDDENAPSVPLAIPPIVPVYEPPPKSTTTEEPPIQDPGNTAKTTMTLTYGDNNPDMSGRPVTGMVSLGMRLNLVLSVFSRDVTLDLHIVKCQAKGDNGRGILLIKDGCSVSSVISQFKEVLGIVQEASFGSHSVRRVSQIAEMKAFNFRRSPQNITLICTIKMCGGECTERPPCVDSDINTVRSTRPAVPIFTQEVTLGKTFYVAGLPTEPSKDMLDLLMYTEPKNEQPVLIEKYPDDCITRRTLFIILGLLSCFYLGILLLCIYCVRRTTVRSVKEHIMEDYESPPKALYSEYSSPRRRNTPQSSPDHATYSVNTEGYKSPMLQRSV